MCVCVCVCVCVCACVSIRVCVYQHLDTGSKDEGERDGGAGGLLYLLSIEEVDAVRGSHRPIVVLARAVYVREGFLLCVVCVCVFVCVCECVCTLMCVYMCGLGLYTHENTHTHTHTQIHTHNTYIHIRTWKRQARL